MVCLSQYRRECGWGLPHTLGTPVIVTRMSGPQTLIRVQIGPPICLFVIGLAVRETRGRLHQATFRINVLSAYRKNARCRDCQCPNCWRRRQPQPSPIQPANSAIGQGWLDSSYSKQQPQCTLTWKEGRPGIIYVWHVTGSARPDLADAVPGAG